MMKPIHGALVLGLFAVRALASAQGHAHEHGALTLDIGVEASTVTMHIASPLDNLVGFEHAPRTDAQRKRVDAALARLRSAQELLVIDAAAQCRLGAVEITSAVLGLGAPASAYTTHDHAELSATVDFHCRDATRASHVDVRLFDAFAGLQRIDVQVAGPRGQFKRTLTRPERRVALTR